MNKRSLGLGILGILLVTAVLGAFSQTREDLFQKALRLERNEGKLAEAIQLYEQVAADRGNVTLAAQAQLRIGLCYEKLGQNSSKQALAAFQKVIDDFPGQQAAVKEAREKLSALLSAQDAVEEGDKSIVIRKLWSSDDVAGDYGSPSPDGRYFAFHHYRSGDLATRDISTGEVRRLNLKTNYNEVPESVGYSCWSPDGKRIAYEWESKPYEIRVVNFDGSGVRTIYKSQDRDWISPYAWSPDGKFILTFLMKQGKSTSQFGILNVENGSLREFDWPVNPSTASVFSPDGRFINLTVSQKDNQRNRDIVLYSLAQDKIIPLVENPAIDGGLGWSPDGRWFIFNSNRSGTPDIWGLPVSDGKPQGDPILIKKAMGGNPYMSG